MTDKEKIRAEIEKVKVIIQSNRAQGAFAEGYLIGQESVLEHFENFVNSMQEEPTAKEYLCIKDFYPYEKGKVYKSIDGGFPANAEEYFKLVEDPTTSVWHDARDIPVAFKTKVVLYTNGKWDMFKAYEAKDDFDNYWAGVNQSLAEKGVFVKQWSYVDDLLKL